MTSPLLDPLEPLLVELALPLDPTPGSSLEHAQATAPAIATNAKAPPHRLRMSQG